VAPGPTWRSLVDGSTAQVVPSERRITAATRYIASAIRCREIWNSCFRRSDGGDRLSDRDLIEMHGAGLGLVWTTHSKDLHSALATLNQVDALSPAPDMSPYYRHEQAKRVLESRVR